MPTPVCAAVRPMARRRGAAARGAVAAVVVSSLLALAACSGGAADKKTTTSPSGSPSSGATTGTTVSVPALAAKPGALAGALPAATRKQDVAAIGKVVDGWLTAAYVGGDYPRTDFSKAFPGFTKGAAVSAKKDEALLSNSQEGGSIQSVSVQRKVAKVDMVADHRKAVGATARVRLLFTTTGAYAKQVRVIGRLFLTPAQGGAWQVFGYQIRKAEL